MADCLPARPELNAGLVVSLDKRDLGALLTREQYDAMSILQEKMFSAFLKIIKSRKLSRKNRIIYLFDLKVNEVINSPATLTPADAGNVTFTSSNSSVVTILKPAAIPPR